jgi:hypothetical protein
MTPPTASKYLGLGLELISPRQAIVLIQNVLDRGPETAYAKLIECCASHGVESKSLTSIPGRPPLLQVQDIPPAVWLRCHPGATDGKLDLDLDSSRFRGPDCNYGLILINGDDLLKRLPRRRRGPVPGMIRRYEEADRALIPELQRLMLEESLSVTEAARRLEDRIAGSNTSSVAKVKRLVKRYNWTPTHSFAAVSDPILELHREAKFY